MAEFVLRVAAVLFAAGVLAGLVFGFPANQPTSAASCEATTVPTTTQPWRCQP